MLVAQAFNTTTSMGRLTLNVLLSFAQFERDVTGKRIRDKIVASKKKGLWMGGPVPWDYEVVDRKLIPVPEEAERVRTIMRRYIASRSANELITELETEGIRTKVQKRTSGPHRGGIPFRHGSLFHLLKNPIYHGKIVHKGRSMTASTKRSSTRKSGTRCRSDCRRRHRLAGVRGMIRSHHCCGACSLL